MLLEEFSQPENLPFAVALVSMFILGSVQIVSLVSGMGMFSFLDDMLPDLDFDSDADIDLDADADIVAEPSILTAFLSWLNLGKVPLLVSLIVFLFLFAFIGFNAQALLFNTIGFRLPGLIAGIGTFALAIPPLRYLNAGIAHIMPKDETSAVSSKTFIGRVATITLGTATHIQPAEARVKGPLGRTHYIMVSADEADIAFRQGEQALLVSRKSTNHFTAIPIANPNLKKTTKI